MTKDFNILSFDGGGSRGVMEMIVIDDVMKLSTLLLQSPDEVMGMIFGSDSPPKASPSSGEAVKPRGSIIKPTSISLVKPTREDCVLASSKDSRIRLRKALDSVKEPLHPKEAFDMLVGTSTGGLITLGLLGGNKDQFDRRRPMSVEEVIDMYKKETGNIFGKRLKPKGLKNKAAVVAANKIFPFDTAPYSQEGLENLLRKRFDYTTLKDFPDDTIGAVVAKELNQDHSQPDRLEIFDTRTGKSFDVTEVLLATSCAPIFFAGPAKVGDKHYIDGGVGGNCPLLQAIPKAQQIEGDEFKLNHVLSIAPPRKLSKDGKPLQEVKPYKQFKFWLQYFPTQLTEGFAAYQTAKESHPWAMFQRLLPKSKESASFELNETDVEAMIKSVLDESLEDPSYFLSVIQAATVIALRLSAGEGISSGLTRFARSLSTIGRKSTNPEDGLIIAKAMYQAVPKDKSERHAVAAYFLAVAQEIFDMKKASICYQETLDIFLGLHGDDPTHGNCSASYNNLGGCLQHLGRYKEAADCYIKAWMGFSTKLNENEMNAEVVTCHNNLATCYIHLGRFQDALTASETCLKRWQKLYDDFKKDDFLWNKANTMSDLGIVHDKLGQFDISCDWFRKSIELRESLKNSSCKSDMDFIANYTNLGTSLEKLGRYEEAIERHEVSLKLSYALFGKRSNHPYIAAGLCNLGNCYLGKGLFMDALHKHEESLELRKEYYKDQDIPHHSDIASSYTNLGRCLEKVGKVEKALVYHLESLQEEKSVHENDPDNIDVAISLKNVAHCYQQMGLYDKALELYEEVLRIERKKHGQSHPSIAITLTNVGNCYLSKAEFAIALPYFTDVLEMRKRHLEKTHPDMSLSHYNLGNCYLSMQDYPLAIEHHKIALDMRRENLESLESKDEISNSLNSLGICQMRSNAYDDALASLLEALELKREVHTRNPNHPVIGNILQNLGNLYVRQEKVEIAIPHLEDCLKIKRIELKEAGSTSLVLAALLKGMSSCYLANDQLEKAQEACEESLEIQHRAEDPHAVDGGAYDLAAEIKILRGDIGGAEQMYRKGIDHFKGADPDRYSDLIEKIKKKLVLVEEYKKLSS